MGQILQYTIPLAGILMIFAIITKGKLSNILTLCWFITVVISLCSLWYVHKESGETITHDENGNIIIQEKHIR